MSDFIIDTVSNELDVTERLTTELRRHLEKQQRELGSTTSTYEMITSQGRVVVQFVSNGNKQVVENKVPLDLATIRAKAAELVAEKQQQPIAE